MKVFISLGMRGRTNDEVENDLYRAQVKIERMFGDHVETVDNWNTVGPDDCGRTWYLGEAIKKLGDCDYCYFCRGWREHKGCLVELEVCKLYGIKIIEEV